MDPLKEIMNLPGITVVSGSQRMGKTAFAFRLCEVQHDKNPDQDFFVYSLDDRFDDNLRKLLPSWFQITHEDYFDNLPIGSVILKDEGNRWANSKNYKKGELAEALAGDVSTVGQRDQFVFILIQNLANLELDYLRMGVRLALKYTYPVSCMFERSQLNKIVRQVMNGFDSRCNSMYARKCLVYLLGSVDGGYYANSMPSFWSVELSKLWSGGGIGV